MADGSPAKCPPLDPSGEDRKNHCGTRLSTRFPLIPPLILIKEKKENREGGKGLCVGIFPNNAEGGGTRGTRGTGERSKNGNITVMERHT
jgi:hypothetical protein